MGVGLYFNALVRATPANAPSRATIKIDLKNRGVRLGWRGLVTASRCLPPEQYNGLLRFLKAVSNDVKMDFTVELPSLAIVLGDKKNPAIDFAALATPKHISKIVTDYFDYRNQLLDLRLLPAYIRQVRNATT